MFTSEMASAMRDEKSGFAARCTCCCLWDAHGWPQLQFHGLWNPLHALHPGLMHFLVTGSCSVCLCLQLHRSTQAPSATM